MMSARLVTGCTRRFAQWPRLYRSRYSATSKSGIDTLQTILIISLHTASVLFLILNSQIYIARSVFVFLRSMPASSLSDSMNENLSFQVVTV